MEIECIYVLAMGAYRESSAEAIVSYIVYMSDFLSMLLELVHAVWSESKVPSEWSDAVLVPIPKRYLKLCIPNDIC